MWKLILNIQYHLELLKKKELDENLTKYTSDLCAEHYKVLAKEIKGELNKRTETPFTALQGHHRKEAGSTQVT